MYVPDVDKVCQEITGGRKVRPSEADAPLLQDRRATIRVQAAHAVRAPIQVVLQREAAALRAMCLHRGAVRPAATHAALPLRRAVLQAHTLLAGVRRAVLPVLTLPVVALHVDLPVEVADAHPVVAADVQVADAGE